MLYQTHSARAQKQEVVGSQSQSSTKNPETSSTNQNRALRQTKTPGAINSVWNTNWYNLSTQHQQA